MKNNKGYTVIELLIVIVVVGVIGIIAINKASYAFPDHSLTEDIKASEASLVTTVATKYGEEHKEIFKDSDTVYIRVLDLIENEYQEDNLSEINNNQKIKLVLNDNQVVATLEN